VSSKIRDFKSTNSWWRWRVFPGNTGRKVHDEGSAGCWARPEGLKVSHRSSQTLLGGWRLERAWVDVHGWVFCLTVSEMGATLSF
jgi:hypothetical protein